MKQLPLKEQRKQRRTTGAITLKDVAELAGVAQITASRAINTPGLVSEKVLKKVLQAVKETGYVQNKIAGGLASSRSKLIAAIIPNFASSIFLETIDALNQTLVGSGYQLLLGQSNYSAQREESLLDEIIGRRPEGIFITGVLSSNDSRSKLISTHIPVVEAWDLTDNPIDMLVGFSHQNIGSTVASFLIDKGYRHLGIIQANDERALRRTNSFVELARHRGFENVDVINVGDSRTVSSGKSAFCKLLDQNPRIDAVFCSSDLLALGVLTQAQILQIKVPSQLGIIGFGDISLSKDTWPSLSTVKINSGEIGVISANLLIARAEMQEISNRIFDLGFTIVERETT
jgi:LacI family gluconate utilization system Gnt-I transcriptional repressor